VLVAVLENAHGDAQLDPIGRLAADRLAQGLMRLAGVEVVPATSATSATSASRHARGPAAGAAGPERLRVLAEEADAGIVVGGTYYADGDAVLVRRGRGTPRRGASCTRWGPRGRRPPRRCRPSTRCASRRPRRWRSRWSRGWCTCGRQGAPRRSRRTARTSRGRRASSTGIGAERWSTSSAPRRPTRRTRCRSWCRRSRTGTSARCPAPTPRCARPRRWSRA
jgi:hypothetical protein